MMKGENQGESERIPNKSLDQMLQQGAATGENEAGMSGEVTDRVHLFMLWLREFQRDKLTVDHVPGEQYTM